MRVLHVTPLGPARIASTPVVSGAELLGGQRVLGAPPPSTVLGALGAALGVRLSAKEVSGDPLYGLGTLVDELSKRRAVQGAILEGPLIRVVKDGVEEVTVPVYSKDRVLLVKLSGMLRAARSLAIEEDDVVGVSKPLIRVGVALRDVLGEPWNRVVEHGYTFRSGLVTYVSRRGGGLGVEFVYKLALDVEVDGLIRFGGEGRHAILKVSELARWEPLNRLTSPLEVEPGLYVVVSYWPLMPRRLDALYLSKENFVGLEVFDDPLTDIIGVPEVKISGRIRAPRLRVVRIGLGFSEVIKVRRPMILALPPGTLLRIEKGFAEAASQVPKAYIDLLRAGYASLLKVGA